MLDNKIIQLDSEISNKIAAGEVVERPLAVVKELVENAIDAKATKIIIEIKNAGKSLIRITDNGGGINPEDLELAFQRHSTSKIRTVNDIYNISSLGFRGEALASIASVSNVEMISKYINNEMGKKIVISGGKIVEKLPTGSPQGTTIFVKDLFFNTPARLKFLKSNRAESNSINDIVNKLALSHPEVSFKYIVDGENIFITPGNNKLFDVILNLFQKTISKNLINVSNIENEIRVEGFISNLDTTRGNKQYQIVFVNNRYIRSQIIDEAISLAYRTLIPQNRFPIVILNINIDPSLIDINIHPAKTEIRFHQEGFIKELIYKAVKFELNRYNLVPAKELNSKKVANSEVLKSYNEINHDVPKVKEYIKPEIKKEYKSVKEDKYIKPTKEEISEDREKAKVLLDSYKKLSEDKIEIKKEENIVKEVKRESKFIKKDNVEKDTPFVREEKTKEEEYVVPKSLFDEVEKTIYDNLKYIGQTFNTYLIFEKNNDIYLIDQHAAHEKVLFEEYVDSFRKRKVYSQMILEPITIEVNYMEKQNILNKLLSLQNLGFSLEEFGENTIIVREIPTIFDMRTSEKLIKDLIDKLDFNLPDERFELSLDNLMQSSCKAAIKANDKLELIEVNSLIDRLKILENPYTCPHGRPIIISINKKELEKKFNRT